MAKVSLTVDLRDVQAIKLHVWEMRVLIDRLRVEANPLAPELERMLDRFLAFGKQDRA